MKYVPIFTCLLFSSCARDIAGLTRDERLTIYGSALTIAGKPEPGAVAYSLLNHEDSSKNPAKTRP